MNGLLHHMLLTLRLNFRSKQALVYGYIFPIIFLLAFWGIYSKEIPPLANELGQLLTVTILSGACFGMPTAMVGERERGVWRRYVLLPSATGGTGIRSFVARCGVAGVSGGMEICFGHRLFKESWPAHPWQLGGTFLFLAVAFLGIGLGC